MKKDFFGIITIQPIAHNLVVVCVKDYKDTVKHLSKKKNKAISDWIKLHHKGDIKLPDGQGGLFYNKEDKPLILFIENKKRDWYFYGTLLHETNHLVYYLSKYCGFSDECEFNAYLHESVFQQIRKLIK